MRYMLICCCEREILTPEFFQTHKDAFNAMCEWVAKVLEESVELVKELYFNADNEYTCILSTSAWAEEFGNNYDWKIFDLENL